jgi:hypothetical protein
MIFFMVMPVLGQTAQIQAVTLVHVYMGARASFLDIRARHDEVSQYAPGALEQVHFNRIGRTQQCCKDNFYQFQASQLAQQKATLNLVGRVLDK